MKKLDTIKHEIAKSTIGLYLLNGYKKSELMTDKMAADIECEVSRYVDDMNGDRRQELEDWIRLYILEM